MNKKFLAGFGVGITSAVAIGVLIFTICVYSGAFGGYSNGSIIRNSKSSAGKSGTGEGVYDYATDEKVINIQNIIDRYFLNKVTEDAVAEGVYKGLMESLDDPYSVYYTKEEYDSIKASTTGKYFGIGAVVSQNAESGIITIVKPYENCPAAEAGLLPGDILYKVNGKEVTGVDLTKVVTEMKGEEGTTVELTVVRDGEADYLDFTVERREVEIPSISYKMLADNIGYIEISEFDEVTAEQFREAIDELEKKGQKGLIIDLRNNGGGVLSTAVDMLDRMIEEGMLVYTEDKNGRDEEYKAEDKDSFDKPLVILVNKNSASASEVFSGAIQDYGIGKLVGTTTFGKGIVQSIIALGDGSAVKLTTSKYFTPKGRNIHGTGLEPDIEVELDEVARSKAVLTEKEDNQLQAGIQEIKKELK